MEFRRVLFRSVDPHGAAVELMDDGSEQLAVHQIQALRIDLEHGQCGVGGIGIDASVGLDLGVIAHPAQKAVGDTRSEKRRAGKECVSTCSNRWAPYDSTKQKREN